MSPRSSLQERRAAVFVGAGILAFVAAALGPALVGHNTLLSVDALTNDFPWLAGGSHVNGHELCSGDTVDSGMSGISYIRNQLFAGHLPNWQSLVAGGSSEGSQPDLGLLSPLSLPYFLVPLWLAPAVVKLIQLIVAIGGTFLFLRRLSVGRAASMLAGFTFAVSGFMVVWSNWPQTQVAALIPALFWSLERLVQRARATDTVLVAAVVASMLLGGFPAVTGWALYAAAAYFIVRLVALHRTSRPAFVRRALLAGGGVVLGGFLSMIQLLPFAEQYRATNFNYRDYESLLALPFGDLDSLVAPAVNGLCTGGTTTYGTWDTIESVAYIGAAALVLAIVGMAVDLPRISKAVRGVRRYFLVTVVVVMVLAWGGGYALHLVQSLPVFSGNFIGRIRSLFGFLLAVFVGFGYDALVRARSRPGSGPDDETSTTDDEAGRRSRPWPAFIALAWTTLGVTVVVVAFRDARVQGEGRTFENRLVVPTLLVLASLVCVALVYRKRLALGTVALYVLPVLVFAQGFQFFHTVLPGDTRKNFYPVTPTHAFLKANLGDERYAAIGSTLYPATSLYYGLRTVTGHSFHETEWTGLLEAIDPGVMQSPTFSQLSAGLTPTGLAQSKILDLMAAQYLVTDPATLVGSYDTLSHSDGTVSVAPGQQAACTVPAGALRGVSIWLDQNWTASNADNGATINVSLTAGGKTITSGRFLGTGVPANTEISIAVAGEDLPAGEPVTVAVSGSGSAMPLMLAGRPGAIDCAAVRPANDQLKLVFADAGSIIYQRLSALPRIRWASQTRVIPDQGDRVNALSRGVPDDEVVLNSPGPTAAGEPATVAVVNDSGDRITANVNAAGAGYLVVADAMQAPGWSVAIDGHKATLVPADDAMVGVAVPAGEHRVSFSYNAPGQLVGAVLSALALLLMLGLIAAERYRWQPRARRAKAQKDLSGSVVSGEGS